MKIEKSGFPGDCSKADVENYQFTKIKALLERVAKTNTYYQRVFQRNGIAVDKIRSLGDFREKIPFMAKKEIVESLKEAPPFGIHLGIPTEDILRIFTTSGTSGFGQEVYSFTRRDVDEMAARWAPHFRDMGLKRGDIVANLLPLSLLNAGWSTHDGCVGNDLNCINLAPLDTKSRLDQMRKFKPKWTWGTPSYFNYLTCTCDELGIDIKKEFAELKAITFGGESYPAEFGRFVEESWNIRLHELYGISQACGYVGGTCEHGAILPDGSWGTIHLPALHIYFEIIDPETGALVKPGEEGELVMTTLLREACPLIRYRIADKVRLVGHGECRCGMAGLGIQAGTITRYDDMIKIKANNIWPSAVDAVIFSDQNCDEYRARVYLDERGVERADVQISLKSGIPRNKEELENYRNEFKNRLKLATNVTMHIEFLEKGALEKFAFKARRWKDERKETLRKA